MSLGNLTGSSPWDFLALILTGTGSLNVGGLILTGVTNSSSRPHWSWEQIFQRKLTNYENFIPAQVPLLYTQSSESPPYLPVCQSSLASSAEVCHSQCCQPRHTWPYSPAHGLSLYCHNVPPTHNEFIARTYNRIYPILALTIVTGESSCLPSSLADVLFSTLASLTTGSLCGILTGTSVGVGGGWSRTGDSCSVYSSVLKFIRWPREGREEWQADLMLPSPVELKQNSVLFTSPAWAGTAEVRWS